MICFVSVSVKAQIFNRIQSALSTTDKPANLVPNPGFEDVIKCPCSWNQKGKEYMDVINSWTSPTETTPDIFSTALPPDCWSNPKKYTKGKQFPHTGQNMMGIKTFGRGGTDTFWHEYLMVKLDSALVPGEKYYAEFYTVHSEHSDKVSNNIGMYFSDTLVDSRSRMPLFFTPQVNAENILDNNNNHWERVRGVFVAKTAAKYLLIGNFYDDKYTMTKRLPQGTGGAYYFIDDVTVRKAMPYEKVTPAPGESIKPRPKVVLKHDEIIATTQVKLDSIDYQVGNTVILKNIFFEFDKATLLPTSQKELNNLYDNLIDYPHLKIEIRGYTDSIGSDVYNQKLSEARAKAVVTYLHDKGIDSNRLSYKGYGENHPIASNSTDAGRQMNRRVEFYIKEN